MALGTKRETNIQTATARYDALVEPWQKMHLIIISRPLSREMAQFWDAACFPKAQRATDNELCVQAIGCRVRSKSTNCTGKTEFWDRIMISKHGLLSYF